MFKWDWFLVIIRNSFVEWFVLFLFNLIFGSKPDSLYIICYFPFPYLLSYSFHLRLIFFLFGAFCLFFFSNFIIFLLFLFALFFFILFFCFTLFLFILFFSFAFLFFTLLNRFCLLFSSFLLYKYKLITISRFKKINLGSVSVERAKPLLSLLSETLQ